MAGLRERQKEQRREEMLSAALSLFRSRGYEFVKLEEIAEEAGFSAGTLYGYFKTKKDLLLAVLVKDFEYGFFCGKQTLDGPATDAISAINQLTRCHFAHREAGPTSEMWRFAVAAFLSHPKSEFSRQYETCLFRIHRQYVRLIRKLKADGHLPQSVCPEEMATFLDSTANMGFLEYIRKESACEAEFEAQQQRLNHRIVDWARKSGPQPGSSNLGNLEVDPS